MTTSCNPAAALPAALAAGFLPSVDTQDSVDEKPVCLFYDLAAWRAGLRSCDAAFGKGFLHALAIKSNPVLSMVKMAVEEGFGVEAASMGEVKIALAAGCPKEKIVLDSPVKTIGELKFALSNGIHINCDNASELERVAKIGSSFPGIVGLRINPCSGSGEIAALSVSTPDSKFGFCLQDDASEEEAVALYRKYPFLNCVHVHVGSGKMGIATLVAGISRVFTFAERVNKELPGRIRVLDMGGGLGVNFTGNDPQATFPEYAARLRAAVPRLFPSHPDCPFDHVVTEFGQALSAPSGWLASRVEVVKPSGTPSNVVLIHFGADLCVRQTYTTQHRRRLEVYDGQGAAKTGAEVPHNIAGPLCFQGDMLAKDAMYPPIRADDVVVMRDAGANTLSIYSRHCSRQAPLVVGYDENYKFTVLKPAETYDQVVDFWAGGQAKL